MEWVGLKKVVKTQGPPSLTTYPVGDQHLLTHLKRRSPSRPLVASSSGNSSREVGGNLVEEQNLLSDSTNSPRPSISMKPRDQHTKLGGPLSRGWEKGRESKKNVGK